MDEKTVIILAIEAGFPAHKLLSGRTTIAGHSTRRFVKFANLILDSERTKKAEFLSLLHKYWPGSVNELLEDHARIKKALCSLVSIEPCDCGCPNKTKVAPVNPRVVVATVMEALGNPNSMPNETR